MGGVWRWKNKNMGEGGKNGWWKGWEGRGRGTNEGWKSQGIGEVGDGWDRIGVEEE